MPLSTYVGLQDSIAVSPAGNDFFCGACLNLFMLVILQARGIVMCLPAVIMIALSSAAVDDGACC